MTQSWPGAGRGASGGGSRAASAHPALDDYGQLDVAVARFALNRSMSWQETEVRSSFTSSSLPTPELSRSGWMSQVPVVVEMQQRQQDHVEERAEVGDPTPLEADDQEVVEFGQRRPVGDGVSAGIQRLKRPQVGDRTEVGNVVVVEFLAAAAFRVPRAA